MKNIYMGGELIGTYSRHSEGWAWTTEIGEWGFARSPQEARTMILRTLEEFWLGSADAI